jgi:hypothetical protein
VAVALGYSVNKMPRRKAQRFKQFTHTDMHHDLLQVPIKSADVCIMTVKDLNNKHICGTRNFSETGISFVPLKGSTHGTLVRPLN